jgi:hypothetical protein
MRTLLSECVREREFSSCLLLVTKLTREAYATSKLVARAFFLCVRGPWVMRIAISALYRPSRLYFV